MQLKAPKSFTGHISNFYIKQLLEQNVLFEFQEPRSFPPEALQTVCDKALIKPWEVDKNCGQTLLDEIHLSGHTARKLLLVHPGSGSPEKCWHIDNFCNVAKMLKSEGFEVLFVLGPRELEIFTPKTMNGLKAIGLCMSELSLSEILGLMSRADCFLGNDSGITHLAAATGLRTVCVFGPTAASLYKPIGPTVKVVQLKEANFGRPNISRQKQLVQIIMDM